MKKDLSHYISHLNSYLALNNLKQTRVRELVLKKIYEQNRGLDAKLIYEILKKELMHKEVNLNAVYRVLRVLVDSKTVKTVNIQSSTIYVLNCENYDSFWITCEKCKRVVYEIGANNFQNQKELQRLLEKNGFNSSEFFLIIKSACSSCKEL